MGRADVRLRADPSDGTLCRDRAGRTGIRHLTTAGASIAALVVLAVPAWAGASFTGETDNLQADTDVILTLQVTEEEELGETTRIVVMAPEGFEAIDCEARGIGWDCTVEPPRRMVFTRNTPLTLLDSPFDLTVHTAAVNGPYTFWVTQSNEPAGEDDTPESKSFPLGVKVVEGQDPPPSPKPSPSPSPAPSPTAGSTGSTSTTDDTGSDGTAASGDTDGDTESDSTSTSSGSTSGSSSGGSTAPRRTQGRSSGTSLEIVPGESTDEDGAEVADPDVAAGPAVAPSDDADASATVAAGDDPTARDGSGGGVPWQQWVGGALLLAGAAVVGVRRWRAS